MTGLFIIVFPIVNGNRNQTVALEKIVKDNGDTVVKTKKLFADYGTLTKQEVAESTKWYAMWPDELKFPWFKENISLLFDYLKKYIEGTLWGKVQEDHNAYKDTQSQGGPLAFFFMMKRLQQNSNLVIETLKTKLKSLRMEKYQG